MADERLLRLRIEEDRAEVPLAFREGGERIEPHATMDEHIRSHRHADHRHLLRTDRTIDARDDEGRIVLVRGHVRISRDALDVRVTRHSEDRDHLGIIDAITAVVLVTLLGVQEQTGVSMRERIASRRTSERENILEVERDVKLAGRVEIADRETLVRVLVTSTERVHDACRNVLEVLILFLENDDRVDDLGRDALKLGRLNHVLHDRDGRDASHVTTRKRIVEHEHDRQVAVHEDASLVIVARDLLDLEVDALILVRSLNNVGHELLTIGTELRRRRAQTDVIHDALGRCRPRGGRALVTGVIRRGAGASCASSKRESCFSHSFVSFVLLACCCGTTYSPGRTRQFNPLSRIIEIVIYFRDCNDLIRKYYTAGQPQTLVTQLVIRL